MDLAAQINYRWIATKLILKNHKNIISFYIHNFLFQSKIHMEVTEKNIHLEPSYY